MLVECVDSHQTKYRANGDSVSLKIVYVKVEVGGSWTLKSRLSFKIILRCYPKIISSARHSSAVRTLGADFRKSLVAGPPRTIGPAAHRGHGTGPPQSRHRAPAIAIADVCRR